MKARPVGYGTFLLALVAWAGLLHAQGQPSTKGARPAVFGKVHDTRGLPIIDAVISIARRLPDSGNATTQTPKQPIRVTGAVVAAAAADRQGHFAIPTLPDGDYVACTSTQMPGVLSDCAWKGSTAFFSVVKGVAPPLDIRLEVGSRIFLRVQDEDGHLAKSSNGNGNGNGNGPEVTTLLLRADGHPLPFRLSGSDKKGRNMEVAIPWDTDGEVMVVSKALRMGDNKKKDVRVAEGVRTRVRHSQKDSASTEPVVVHVLGSR